MKIKDDWQANGRCIGRFIRQSFCALARASFFSADQKQKMRRGTKTTFMASALMLLVLGYVGCGGSSDNNQPIIGPQATTGVLAVGEISGFGSVIVNGIDFDTSSTTVMMDDSPGTLSQLRIGMIVSVHGTVNNDTGAASARDVMFVDDAEGVITSINQANNSFVVLGRTVMVDELTVFDDMSFDTMAVGNVVQVSGHWRSQEQIQATHVLRIANAYSAGMEMEVKGEISGLNTNTMHFNIGTQVCDYSSAMLQLGGATLDNGLYVEVTSTSALANGDLILDQIQARDRDQDRDRICDSDCDFELDGYITRFVSATDFDVDNFPVTTTSSTVYVNGTVSTLAMDVQVAVDGILDSSGIFVADRIVFRLPSLIEISADVEAIDSAAASVTVLGITVATNESTMFRDDSSANVSDFGIDNLAVGDRVEIRAYLDGTVVTATKVERDDAATTVVLKAVVESFSQPSITLLGVTVMADTNTIFQDVSKTVIDESMFFGLLTTDSLVRAEGSYDGTSITADKMFLRECMNSCM